MEIIAIPVTKNKVDMPGKASEVHIYGISENKSEYLIKEYKNPSIEIKNDGGLPLLESLIRENVNIVIVPGMGGPGMRFLNNRVKVYISEGNEKEVIKNYLSGRLQFTDKPTIFDCPQELFIKADEYKSKK